MAGEAPGRRPPWRKGRVKTERGPEPLAEVLSRLFAARGWGRRQERLRLEQAWAAVTDGPAAGQTHVGAFRRGVLEIVVENAVLLQELAHYQKRRLLEGLRNRLPGVTVNDLRFRAGGKKSSQ